jgi:hypothetical protein
MSSYDQANYEVSLKKPLDKVAVEGDDPRDHRLTKKAETFTLNFEDESIKTSESYLF